jgi:hypothetical protein
MEKRGIVCLVLTDRFVDFAERQEVRDTDLSKRLLAWFEISREEFGTRMTHVRSKVNELSEFCKVFGAAWSSLFPRHREDTKTLDADSDDVDQSIRYDADQIGAKRRKALSL